MVISVIGLGKLGLCTAACFASAGYRVYGFDINKVLIKTLKKGEVPFFEPGLKDLLNRVKNNLYVTYNIEEAIEDAKIIFIIVPTPSNKDGAFSNEFILRALNNILPIVKKKKDFVIIDIVSTVMPGSGEHELIPYIERLTEKKVGCDIGYVYNPEFIAIGSVIKDFLNPDVVLIGESDKRSGDFVADIYKNVCENNPYIARTSIINAEIAKLCINCFCTMKISFANFLAELVDKIPNASAKEITSIIGQDSRIGIKYISPGLGFGGPCFPRDNEAFIKFALDLQKKAPLQEAVIEINNKQVKRAVDKICSEILKMKKTSVVVSLLGLAYKPYTYLTERSQQLEVAKALLEKENISELRVYDPLVNENYGWIKSESLEECVDKADIVAILTPYPEFLDVESWKKLIKPEGKIINFWS